MKFLHFIKVTIRLCTLLCVFSLSCLATPFLDNQSSTNQKLKDVKSEISNAQSALNNILKKRTRLENQLKESDIAISLITQKIQENTNNKKIIQNKLIELEKNKSTLITSKTLQEELLAKQLRAAYSAGHHDYIKLLLNQKNPATIQRTITHYQYVNNARIKEIENFKKTIDELILVEEKHKKQSSALDEIKNELAINKKSLEQNKEKRKSTLILIKKEQLTKKQQLDKLISEEKSLKDTLNKLKQLAKASKNLDGLAKLKRKLKWPVSGRIIHNFGTQKHGYIKWKGVLIKAPLGKQIKSIYNGKVLFSDWLKGYGLVTIIDHGKGYMSLYGYNQTLLKKVGDNVEQGEPIALAGQSGGQSQPGLYFEIRHTGQAKNPKLWCR
ncbi:peptidoglycan DD-metalloendopeptidase family protein [Colwellia sp. UCD-KL20]|uniref:murein hydrolase activator EnvC family protein n=1 Tax=Colwellia sp. UCD-KL20 TaxID=1917165 RepID=UPI0009707BC8|nr:peptidoglycan DD-metalloendopeptidase family protein [Colwellia sp. UCD-KL20]